MNVITKWKNGLRAKLLLVGLVPILFAAVLITMATIELRSYHHSLQTDELIKLTDKAGPTSGAKELSSLLVQIKEQQIRAKETIEAKSKRAADTLILLSIIAILMSVLFTIYQALKVLKIFSSLSVSLAHSSDDLGTTSAHMSSISFELSQATTSQAAALSQISSSLEEVTAMVGKNADNSKRSASESTQASMRANEGQSVVNQLMDSIDDINRSNESIMNQVTSSNQKFSEIIKVIKEIENKTKVINEIVFQTKLLSFNASVEAARAGEHGTGFAVVAEEVGKLAEMSGNASTEISQMLTSSIGHVESIVQDSQRNVRLCIEEGSNKVKMGVKIANDCKQVLSEINNSIQIASSVAQEISEASEEQKLGVAEILKAINQLDTITNKNAQTASEAAHSSKELEGYADSVSKDVNMFMYALEGDALKISRFPWSDKLVLHVDAMDNQHKVLVEKMDAFFHCLDNGTHAESKEAFSALATATVSHFQSEEKFLASINYPNLATHKQIHKDLVDTVMKHSAELDQGRLNKYQVSEFLKNWLSVHIMGQDQHYSRFYHKDY